MVCELGKADGVPAGAVDTEAPEAAGGPSTDQFDALNALVSWVEDGVASASITASARGPGNPGGVNGDVPATWTPTRTRPLCPYPTIARYKGTGDVESASSFTCR